MKARRNERTGERRKVNDHLKEKTAATAAAAAAAAVAAVAAAVKKRENPRTAR